MTYVRAISFLIGVAILVIAPLLLLSDTARMTTDVVVILKGGVAVLTVSSGYFFVALCGKRILRSKTGRAIAALLLSLPLAACVFLIATGRAKNGFELMLVLMGVTVMLGIFVLFPPKSRRHYYHSDEKDPSADDKPLAKLAG